jgi:diguanylate cyclase (GGDEF)-like protein
LEPRNRGAEELTGYSAFEAVSRQCRDNLLCHVDESGRQLCLEGCPMAATLEDGESRSAEVFLHHKDGYRVPVRVTAVPLRGDVGEIVAAVETFSSNAEKMAALEQVRDLERIASVDALTDIPNRRFLQQSIATRLDEVARYGGSLSLVLLDIDHFKAVNDRYGHDAGDRVLRVVARTLQGATRSFDVVGRWGGEEFLAVLPNTSAADVEGIADRYRALVERSDVPLDQQTVHVTVSAGAATARQGDSATDVFERVDRLLYRSKDSGRNRVSAETEW